MRQQIINDRYQIESHLGRGSQGDVLLAIDQKLGRQVAIKVLRLDGGFDSQAEQSLRREAMVMARFHHANVVAVHDYDVTSDTHSPFLVMEYLRGEPVDKIVDSLSDIEVRQLVGQVGNALHEAHEIGLVHRDLKPANLMLVDRGKPYQRFMILDLGIAKLTESAQVDFEMLGSMTFSGAGTPFYMAPEQAEAKAVDNRADIYAMGSMIYEFISGHSPFAKEADSLPRLLSAVIGKLPEPLVDISQRSCSLGLSNLVMKCLEKDPALRPTSMRELVDQFEQHFVSTQLANAVPPPPVIPPPVHAAHLSGQSGPSAGAEAQPSGQVSLSMNSGSSLSAGATLDPASELATGRADLDDTARQSSHASSVSQGSSRPHRMMGIWIAAGVIGLTGIVVILFGVAAITGTLDDRSKAFANGDSHGQEEITRANSGKLGDSTKDAVSEDASQPNDTQDDHEDAEQAVSDLPSIEKIDFGTRQLSEGIPWTLKPDFGGDAVDGYELAEGAPVGLTINPRTGRLAWTPTEEQGPGDYPITIVSTVEGGESLVVDLRLIVAEINQPPRVKPVRDISSDELDSIRFVVEASDSDVPPQELTYRLVGESPSAARLDTSTGQFSWTPTERDGPGQFETAVEVSDGESSTQISFALNVREVNTRPEFRQIAEQSVDEEQELAFTISASDIDLPATDLVYEMTSDDLTGARFDPATQRFSWTPGEVHGPGEFIATFTVFDGNETEHINVPIVVREVSRPPILDKIAKQEATLGEPFRYRVVARDPDLPDKSIRYELKYAPDGMTIDPNTGQIDWVIGLRQIREAYLVQIIATKSDDLVARGEFTITTPDTAEVTNSIGMKLVFVSATGLRGLFKMGSPESEDGHTEEETQHRVLINKSFLLGAHEVTRGQFSQFVIDTGYETQAERVDSTGGWGWNVRESTREVGAPYNWRNPGFPQTDNHPVVNVSWHDAKHFCEWLSEKEGKTYRLPTEAEWEFACRAGSLTAFSFGDNSEDLANHANVLDRSASGKLQLQQLREAPRDDGYVFTAPVGEYSANAFGFYDMHGNVEEWCLDRYDAEYYKNSPLEDPEGPDFGSSQVIRGGHWFGSVRGSRSSCRRGSRSWSCDMTLGFRLLAELPNSEPEALGEASEDDNAGE